VNGRLTDLDPSKVKVIVAIEIAQDLSRIPNDTRCELGLLSRSPKFPAGTASPGRPNSGFEATSHAWILRFEGGTTSAHHFANTGKFGEYNTQSRWYTGPTNGSNDPPMVAYGLIPDQKEGEWIETVDGYGFCGPLQGQQGTPAFDTIVGRPASKLAPGPTKTAMFVTAPPSGEARPVSFLWSGDLGGTWAPLGAGLPNVSVIACAVPIKTYDAFPISPGISTG